MFKYLNRNHRLVMLALFIWALGEGLWYLNLRQLYLVELGATSAQVGIVLAIEAITRALLPIPAGLIGDRFGVRRMMIASWFLGMAGPLVGAFATTWQHFIPGLIIYAMSAFAVPVISAFVLQSITVKHQPGLADRVLTAVYAAYPVGLIISPAVGGFIAEAIGIRACLWISSGLFAVSTAIILLTRRPATVKVEHHEQPSALLGNTAFIQMVLYYGLVIVALFVSYLLIPNFLHDVRGLRYSAIGLLFSIMYAGTAVINLFIGRLNPRWNLIFVLGIFWLALLGIWQAPGRILIGASFFASGAIWVVRVVATARVAGVVSAQNQGLAFGMPIMIILWIVLQTRLPVGEPRKVPAGHSQSF